MQAYATSERLPLGDQLRVLARTSLRSNSGGAMSGDSDRALIEHLLGRLADLVVDRLMESTEANSRDRADQWLDARAAADHLGINCGTLRKVAAQRAIPTQQEGPRCKLYFRRDELDDWRRSARHTRRAASVLRSV
jgi:hypothetical protein